MHVWGEWPDELFRQVDDAAYEIGQFCRFWGRIGVRQTKEKYGISRVYCSFGFHQLFSITHPGYVFNRYPQWLWHLDCIYISKLFRFIRLDNLVVPYQRFIYRLAYSRALKKYSLIREEILNGADYQETLKSLYKKYNIECTWTQWNGETEDWEKLF